MPFWATCAVNRNLWLTEPDNTRSLATCDLHLRYVHFLVQSMLNFGC